MDSRQRKRCGVWAGAVLATAGVCSPALFGQACTTQAKLPQAQRTTLEETALAVGTAIQSGDTTRLHALSAAALTSDPRSIDSLVASTAPHLAGDKLQVTQLYLLDASTRKDPSAAADFACALSGSTSETDFSISNLPAGVYAFAMVEASGGAAGSSAARSTAQPWLLSLLLLQQPEGWKLAGFFPHARSAAGHDGVWYWTAAREKAAAKQPWAAFLLYEEAFALLQPASFVSSTNLDRLESEQRAASPPELSQGVSAESPYVLSSKAGEFHYTEMRTIAADDGQRLLLTLHIRVDSTTDTAAARARNLAAAAALIDAHPEVRSILGGVTVFSDVSGQLPFATQYAMSEIP